MKITIELTGVEREPCNGGCPLLYRGLSMERDAGAHLLATVSIDREWTFKTVQTFHCGETPTLSVRILDGAGNAVPSIAGALARFAFGREGIFVQRNSLDDPGVVWFSQEGDEWLVSAVLLPTDTPTEGVYKFEFRIDTPDGRQGTVCCGLLKASESLIP